MKQQKAHQAHADYYDIAVVGGGIGGIYTAWRLMMADKENPGLLKDWKAGTGAIKIGVFEGSDRIGGRLLSVQPQNFEGDNFCEIGGMRFINNQPIIASLVNYLKFTFYPQVVDAPNNILYLRRHLLRIKDESDPVLLPYWLTIPEQEAVSGTQQNPGSTQNLISWAMEEVLPELKTIKTQAELIKFLRTTQVSGSYIWEQGFWNLISEKLSNEGREVAIKTVGYDILGGNTNAYNSIIENMDFTTGVAYNMLYDGYNAVPWKLQEQFENAGGEVIMGHWLEGFDTASLENGKTGVTLSFHNKDEQVTARAIICAMPHRSLELLAQKGPVLDPAINPGFRFLMNAVTPVPLFKMCLVYDYPWWHYAGVTQGRSITDLPLRQLYYLDSTGPFGQKLLMAYNDMESSIYWSGYQKGALGPWNATMTPEETTRTKAAPARQGKGSAAHPRHIKNHAGAKLFRRQSKTPQVASMGGATATEESVYEKKRKVNWANHPAPKNMVDEMHRQIMEMHGVPDAPAPIDAAFIDWSDDPYGAAVHFWNTGYKSWEIMDMMARPVADFPCFIVGEAWSEVQTWAEGALQTAEIVLTKHFGLSDPAWLNPPASTD